MVDSYYGGGCYDCGGWNAAGAAGSANAYAAGVAAGSSYPMGAIYPSLPAGCMYRPLVSTYECGGVWLSAAYGANGVYYRVVPAP